MSTSSDKSDPKVRQSSTPSTEIGDSPLGWDLGEDIWEGVDSPSTEIGDSPRSWGSGEWFAEGLKNQLSEVDRPTLHVWALSETVWNQMKCFLMTKIYPAWYLPFLISNEEQDKNDNEEDRKEEDHGDNEEGTRGYWRGVGWGGAVEWWTEK